MGQASYPTQGIHLPLNDRVIKQLKLISTLSGITTLLVSSIIFIFWILSVTRLINPLGLTQASLFFSVAIFFGSLSIFIQKQTKTINPLGILQKTLTIISGAIVFGAGALIFLSPTPLSIAISYSPLMISSLSGITFLFLGSSIIISFIKIPHRFHYAQLFIFIAIFLNTFRFLDGAYKLLYTPASSHYQWISFGVIVVNILICQSILFSKPERGYLRLIMTDNLSSMLARRFIFWIVVLLPFLGLFIILGQTTRFYESNSWLTLAIVFMLIIGIVTTWLNTRTLYKSEQERFLMKEALRINNITLQLNADDLSYKVVELEKENKEVVDKVNNQERLRDIMDNLD